MTNVDHDVAVAEYNLYRRADSSEPFCYAPFVNMHFAPGGTVAACCFNRSHKLGTYPQDSVADIWNGKPVQQLREALAVNDLSKGCQKCHQQLHGRDFIGLYAESYRDAAHKSSAALQSQLGIDPLAPRKLEFDIHNTCNLACVMCHGISSSKIRSGRDAMPALPCPYDEAFVDQLAPFLPQVVEAGFAGGEPFLIKLYYKIWERLAACNANTVVMVVTNGTILNDRVRSVIEPLNCVINISVDSIVKETYESIRKASSLELVLENSRYFAELMKRKGFPFIWRCCVMRQNWREIPDMTRFCNDNDIRIIFNQVEQPLNFSLHTMSPQDLEEVIRFLERADKFDSTTPVQTFNRDQYRGLLDRLKGLIDADNWRNSFLYRLEIAQSSDSAISSSYADKSEPDDLEQAASFGEQVALYVRTRLTVDQAAQENSTAVLPPIAGEALTKSERQLHRFRAKFAVDEFLRIYLNLLIRTYVNVWGEPADHSASVFDKVDRFAETIAQHPDCDSIVDDLLLAAPAKVYQSVAETDPETFGWSHLRGSSDACT